MGISNQSYPSTTLLQFIHLREYLCQFSLIIKFFPWKDAVYETFKNNSNFEIDEKETAYFNIRTTKISYEVLDI